MLSRSVYQMMRGAEMLFAAVFSVVFLHRTLNRLHLMGILCCVVSAIAALHNQSAPSLVLVSPPKQLLYHARSQWSKLEQPAC